MSLTRMSSVAHHEEASARNPVDTARETYYGANAVAQASKGPSLVFSYASPASLKQARLEALQIKMQERLKASLPSPPINPYEGLETYEVNPGDDEDRYNSAESGRMRPGGPEQYQVLVVPPEWSQRGDEKLSTAKLVENGRIVDYQRNNGRAVGPAAKGTNVSYHMSDAAQAAALKHSTAKGSHAAPAKGSHAGTPGAAKAGKDAASTANGRSKQDTAAAAAAATPVTKARNSSGGVPHRDKAPSKPVDPRMTTLKHSVTTPYVPVVLGASLVPPNGLGTTAQIVAAVRATLEGAVMRPFLTSAPATAAQRNVNSGDAAPENAGSGGALVRNSYAGGSDLASGSLRNGSGNGAAPGGDKSAVPLVKVQEEDLLAMYKQQSTKSLMALAGLSRPPSFRFARSSSARSNTDRLLQRQINQSAVLQELQQQQHAQAQQDTPAGRKAAAQAAREAVEATSQAAVASLILAMAPPAEEGASVPGFAGLQAGHPSEQSPRDGRDVDAVSVSSSRHPGSPRSPRTPRSPRRQASGLQFTDHTPPTPSRQSLMEPRPQSPQTGQGSSTNTSSEQQQQGSMPQSAQVGHSVAFELVQPQTAQHSVTGVLLGRSQRLSTVGESTEFPQSHASHSAQHTPHTTPGSTAASSPRLAVPTQQPGAPQAQQPASAEPPAPLSQHQGLEQHGPADRRPQPAATSPPVVLHPAYGLARTTPPALPAPHWPDAAHSYTYAPHSCSPSNPRSNSALYRWQTTGPRHRSRPVSSHTERMSVDGTLPATNTASAGPARPQSAGRGGFSFAMTGTGLTQALASRGAEGERASPQALATQGRLIQTSNTTNSVLTRKTTSRDRNGLLAWRGVMDSQGPATSGPWDNSAPLDASFTASTAIGILAPARPQSATGPAPPATIPAAPKRPSSAHPASTTYHKTTFTIAQLNATAACKSDLQHRVLEQAAAAHGLESAKELLNSHAAAASLNLITAMPAAANHLQLQLAHAPRPATAPVSRNAPSQAAPQARALSAPYAHSATSHGPGIPLARSASAVGPPRMGCTNGGAAQACRPQSAKPLNASGVLVHRTRPPSAGHWSRPGPLLASRVAEASAAEENELVWTSSTNALENVPGVSMTTVCQFPVMALAV